MPTNRFHILNHVYVTRKPSEISNLFVTFNAILEYSFTFHLSMFRKTEDKCLICLLNIVLSYEAPSEKI